MNPEQIRQLVFQRALAMTKVGKEQLLQQANLLGDRPDRDDLLTQLAVKLAEERTRSLQEYAAQLGQNAPSEATDFLRRGAGMSFDRGNEMLQANEPQRAQRNFQMAQATVPHPDTLRAIEMASGRIKTGQ